MDYKKIIKSRRLRMALLDLLSFIPDKTMIKWQYRIKTGRRLDLTNPKRYTEKIQWYKLNYRDPLMVKCADKYEVRKYIEEKGLASILTQCYGVFEDAEEIDYSNLPKRFVVKNTLGFGGTSVIICKDKDDFNADECKKTVNSWLNIKMLPSGGREWPYYSGKKPRVIIEEFLEENTPRGLIDYKFMCFNGEVRYVYVLCDRILGKSVKQGIFTRDFQLLHITEIGDEIPQGLSQPPNYYRMIDIAETLSKDFPHVRVDLYNIDGSVYFGELTFFDGSGYGRYEPDTYDYALGEAFDLPLDET